MNDRMPTRARSRSLREWARAQGLGYTWCRSAVRRVVAPLPAVFVAHRYRVDEISAAIWLDRESGRSRVNLGQLVNELAAELGAR
jgi:hypothetical protein